VCVCVCVFVCLCVCVLSRRGGPFESAACSGVPPPPLFSPPPPHPSSSFNLPSTFYIFQGLRPFWVCIASFRSISSHFLALSAPSSAPVFPAYLRRPRPSHPHRNCRTSWPFLCPFRPFHALFTLSPRPPPPPIPFVHQHPPFPIPSPTESPYFPLPSALTTAPPQREPDRRRRCEGACRQPAGPRCPGDTVPRVSVPRGGSREAEERGRDDAGEGRIGGPKRRDMLGAGCGVRGLPARSEPGTVCCACSEALRSLRSMMEGSQQRVLSEGRGGHVCWQIGLCACLCVCICVCMCVFVCVCVCAFPSIRPV
jgi:hypothetical protein